MKILPNMTRKYKRELQYNNWDRKTTKHLNIIDWIIRIWLVIVIIIILMK